MGLPLFAIYLGCLACFAAPLLSEAEDPAAIPTKDPVMGSALLVGNSPPGAGNYVDFYLDLDKSKLLFSGWNQTVLSALGPSPATELNSMYTADLDPSGNPLLVHRDEPGAKAADLTGFEQAFKNIATSTPVNQPLMVYFSGHGGQGFTELAGGKDLTQDQLARTLKNKNPNQTAVFVFDNCFSASMFPAILSSKNTCAFAAAQPDEYGTVGQMIMDKAVSMTTMTSGPANFSEVMHQMQSEDDNDSLEMATSDYFLEQYYDKGSVNQKLENTTPLCVPDDTNSTQDLVSDTLIKTQFASIQDDIQKSVDSPALKNFKLSPSDSYSSLQEKVASLNEQLAQADKQSDQIDTVDGQLSTSFIKSQMGDENWKKYSEAKNKLDKLREKQETEQDLDSQKKIQSQIDSETKIYETYRNQVAELETAIDYGDQNSPIYKNFSAYCKAQKPDFVCPANIAATIDSSIPVTVATCEAGAENLVESLESERRPFLRLSMELKEVDALKRMEQNHDTQAIQKYTELIQCENTQFRRNPWPSVFGF